MFIEAASNPLLSYQYLPGRVYSQTRLLGAHGTPVTTGFQKLTPCPICCRPLCRIRTHWQFAYKVQPRVETKSSSCFDTTFVWSYAFNPLSQAIDYTLRAIPQAADLLLSVPGLHNASTISSTLQVIGSDIRVNTPFEDPVSSTFGDIGEGWICLASSDHVACVSILCLWAVEAATDYSGNARLASCRFELTNHLLKMLRRQLDAEEEGVISDGTVFAASTHINYSNLFFEQSTEERAKLMDGLEALVNARGGLQEMVETTSPRHRLGLMQCVIWSDELTAWRNATEPRFRAPEPPTMLGSLVSISVAAADVHESYASCCDPEILSVAQYMRLFLFFRAGNELRATSKAEYTYLVQKEVQVHYRLLRLHAKYIGTESAMECIVLAMGIVRCEVLSRWEHHTLIRTDIRRRLVAALKSVKLDVWLNSMNGNIEPIVWVCIMGLTQARHVTGEEQVYLDTILDCLETQCMLHTEEWRVQLLNHSRPLLWHADHDAVFEEICNRIGHHINNRHQKRPKIEKL